MIKYILSFIFALALMALPMEAVAASSVLIIEQDQQPVVSLLGESTIRIVNANAQIVYVYNVAGVCVQSFKVDGYDRHYDLNLGKGCYIVKVGKTVRKINIK